MIKQKIFNRKRRLAKCMLVVCLLFSFIVIAGCSVKPNSIFVQTVQTGQAELVCLGKNPATNKTVLFSRNSLSKNQISFHSHYSNLISSLIYNQLVNVEIESYLKKIHSILIPLRFFPINNIPQNSAEEILPSLKA